jgi:hypothetical protein
MMVATALDNDKPGAQDSPAMRNDRSAKHAHSRFAAFIDPEDTDDDNGGGVMLRDFEDDSHTSRGGSVSTPMGTSSSASSGNGRATHPRKNTSTVSFSVPATTGRRNTIAPIGTGRFSEYTTNVNGGAALDASVDAWVGVGSVSSTVHR